MFSAVDQSWELSSGKPQCTQPLAYLLDLPLTIQGPVRRTEAWRPAKSMPSLPHSLPIFLERRKVWTWVINLYKMQPFCLSCLLEAFFLLTSHKFPEWSVRQKTYKKRTIFLTDSGYPYEKHEHCLCKMKFSFFKIFLLFLQHYIKR